MRVKSYLVILNRQMSSARLTSQAPVSLQHIQYIQHCKTHLRARRESFINITYSNPTFLIILTPHPTSPSSTSSVLPISSYSSITLLNLLRSSYSSIFCFTLLHLVPLNPNISPHRLPTHLLAPSLHPASSSSRPPSLRSSTLLCLPILLCLPGRGLHDRTRNNATLTIITAPASLDNRDFGLDYRTCGRRGGG